MKSVLVVAVGGALGSIARHLLSGWTLHHTLDWRFPLGTFLVNVIGCFAVGLLGGLVLKHDFFSSEMRLFLFTGIAGGFTTFSAFGLETFHLLRRGEVLMAGGYIAASVTVGLLLLWIGFTIVSGGHDVARPQRKPATILTSDVSASGPEAVSHTSTVDPSNQH